MVSPYLKIGVFSIRWYSVFLILAIFIPYLLVRSSLLSKKIKSDILDNLFLIVIPLGILGARLYHVIDKWSYYRVHLLEIFYLWQGGLGIFGGLFFGLVGLLVYGKVKRINLFFWLDTLAPYVLLGQAIGRVGNFFNQEGFGPPTLLPWKVYIDPAHRPAEFMNQSYFHPTFFYEGLWDLVGFLLGFWLTKKKLKTGLVTAFYLVFYGLGRLGTEALRLDTFKIQNFKTGYLISLLLIVSGLFLVTRLSRIKGTNES